MVNYVIDPKLLTRYVPHKTELDFWNNRCYVSLVGFMFLNTRLKGIFIPFHSNFEEVNLRFYVRYKDQGKWKRGVVFMKEIVPKPALTLVANTVYGEKYETLPMSHIWEASNDKLKIEYSWEKNRLHKVGVVANENAVEMNSESEEEFITEHFWGYTKIKETITSEYQVEHPRWKVYPVDEYYVDVDFDLVYGGNFVSLNHEKPTSVFLAEGSEIVVRSGKKIS